jgi:hypothetical protein
MTMLTTKTWMIYPIPSITSGYLHANLAIFQLTKWERQQGRTDVSSTTSRASHHCSRTFPKIPSFRQVCWQVQIKLPPQFQNSEVCLSPGAYINKLCQTFWPANGPRRCIGNAVAVAFTNPEKCLGAYEHRSTGISVWQHWLGLSLRDAWCFENVRCEG